MNITKIPDILKKNTLWCVWKSGKIPCNPRTGKNAKTSLPETFSDFETACNALKKGCSDGSKYEGLGLLIYNGFCAIDIDHCINEKGELSDIAKDITTRMDSYTEISPSGTGIHIIFTVRNFQFDKEMYYINNQKIGLEVYISESTKKFITITGNTINDNDIADNPPALQEILEKYMHRNQSLPLKSKLSSSSSMFSNRDYLQIGLKKDEKLIAYWNGNRPLKSESENDMGLMSKLLYWTNGNADEAIKAFLSSPYASQKDPAHKKKIQRSDYLQRLIQAAMPSKTAAQSNAEYQAQQKGIHGSSQKEHCSGLKIVSAQKLQESKLPPVKYLVEDILPHGTSILTAASKIGKSWFVLDMGLKISAGKSFFNKKTEPTGVLYLALEDSHTRLQDRINKVLNHKLAPENFYFLTEVPNLENGLLTELETILTNYPEIKFIIIDTLQKIRGQALLRESAYQQDYREMGLIKKFSDKHEVSIFIVHHNRKLKDDDDPFNMISGTNGIMGALDTIFMITKKSRNDQEAILHITGRDVLQSDTVIQFNKDTCQWEVIGDKQEMDKKEYENNLIVKAIKELVNSNGCWKGTASSLIKEAQKLHIYLSATAQEIGYKIKNLQDDLYKYDRIDYEAISNGNAGKLHCFFRRNHAIEPITFEVDEETADNEDYDDVVF